MQELCDSGGRLQYSLYGVVVHSGGMQDGHYVAYIKTRTPHDTSIQTTPTGTEQEVTQTTPTGNDQDAPKEQEATPTGNDPDASKEQEATGDSCSRKTCGPARRFDYSWTEGQWYYASDSHVRAATEAEVLKTQAYLLFYERLPIINWLKFNVWQLYS